MNMENNIKILNIDDILPNRFQPRIQFSDKNLNELADSIKEHGVIQPIVVRKISDKYEIIAGERRYKASILAGKTTIPAIITDLNDKDSAEIALIENVQRQDLTPIEEAISYKKILDMGYITQTELADKLGKTQSTIANKLRLLNLDDEVQEALLDGKISERHARSLLRLDNNNQINMLNRIISERLTVRRTDEEVDKLLNNKNSENQNVIKDEKVDTIMNEEIKNEFNIPTNPIYTEDIKPIEPIITTSVDTQSEMQTDKKEEELQNTFINPGFMDIDKIANNAEDIFPKKEPANIDSLLEVTTPVEEPMSAMAPIPEIQPEEEKQHTGGKFFNMFNFNQQHNENPNYVENVEKEETNLDFGMPKRDTYNPFDMNIQTEPEPLATNLDSINNNVEYTQSIENSINNDIFGQSTSTISENIIENSTTSNTYNREDLISNVDPVTSVSPEEISTFESPVVEEELFTSVNPYHLNEDSDFTMKIPVNQINENLNTSLETVTNFEEPQIVPEIKSEELISMESMTEPQNKFVSADFKTVINTIRECSSTIQKYGYKVEVEELDFEDKYQVTFNIEK